MRDIIWDKLGGFEKFIFILGWFSVANAIFWIIMLITYSTRDVKNKKYRDFFSPHTYKVPYVYGWINFIILLTAVFIITIFSIIFAINLSKL